MFWASPAVDWLNRVPLEVDLRQQRLFHVPTEGDRDKPIAATGVFAALHARGLLGDYHCHVEHFDAIAAGDVVGGYARLASAAERFQPTIVLWQHPGSVPVPRSIVRILKGLRSQPLLGYDEKDAYLFVRKRLGRGAATLAREADHVFLAGTGPMFRRFKLAGARSISYSPSEVDEARFGTPWTPTPERRFDVVMVGNHLLRSRRWLPIDPLPGISDRAELARRLGDRLGERFALYGQGWDGFTGWRGPLPFEQQERAAREAWLTVGWDHALLPYNFSNRLPVMLLSGVPYLTNRHVGYDRLFRDGLDLFLVRSVDEAVSRVQRLLTRRQAIAVVGQRGQELARNHFTTRVVYERQLAELAALRLGHRAASGV